jgi:chromosome transmission fidelity protein 8
MTTSVTLHPRDPTAKGPSQNPLPRLIQTPSGLALLELQGTINLPDIDASGVEPSGHGLQIGRIIFPDHHPDTQDASSTAWMKQVHLYVGQHQRLTGEVKKLPKALAIIRKRPRAESDVDMAGSTETAKEDLEVVEIVKYKLVFSHRPEPVGAV